MTVHFLLPRKIGNFPVEFHEAEPEIGGINVCIWRSEACHEGFMVHCTNWGAAQKLVRDIERNMPK